MSITARVLAGIPPYGLGLYSRNRPDAPGPFAWRTGRDWIFRGPDASRPENIERTISEAVVDAEMRGAQGIIIDPENGWESADESQWRRLAELVEAAATRVRVIVTTHLGLLGSRGLALFARLVGRKVVFSPQLYFDIETNARGWERARALFGWRMIPSIAGYVRGPITSDAVAAMRGTPEGYRRYIDALPMAAGAIVWPVHPMPPYMLDALGSRYSGLGSLTLAPAFVLGALGTIGGLIVATVLALVVVGISLAGLV